MVKDNTEVELQSSALKSKEGERNSSVILCLLTGGSLKGRSNVASQPKVM